MQAGTVLGRDAAPGLMLVGAWRAGAEASTLEVEVAAGYTGTGVFRLAAAPQALDVAAFAPRCAGQPTGAGTHCGQSAGLDLTLNPASCYDSYHPHLSPSSSANATCQFFLHFLPAEVPEAKDLAPVCPYLPQSLVRGCQNS